MKKIKHVTIPNLLDVSFHQALSIAYAICPLTYEEIAERMGKGRETIYRYFTDMNYNPPSHLIPKLCKVMGNYLLIEWQIAQVGAHMIFVDTDHDDNSIQYKLGELTKEFSDVLLKDSQAKLDGEYNDNELSLIEMELEDLTKKSEQLQSLIRQKRGLNPRQTV